MRIEFTGTTNKDYVMINTAKFKLKSGSVITVDRGETDWSIDNGRLEMEWLGCYIWAIDDMNIFDQEDEYGHPVNTYYAMTEFKKLVEGAELKLELEDDADEDYEVKIESWNIS